MIFKVTFLLLFLCHLACAKTVRVGRIATGTDAVATENLDYAYLDIVFQNQGQRCGASLIAPQFLLTSATCVVDPAEGLATAINVTFPNVKEINTFSKISVNPTYAPASHVDDIAIIKLTKPMKPDGKTVALAQIGTDPTADKYVNKILRVCGMGSTANAPKPPKKLQCTNVNGVAAATCSANSGIICTKWPDRDNNVCNGDYGSPLYLTSSESGSLTQTVIGIAQYAPDLRPNAPCLGGQAISYAQVAGYAAWIISEINAP